MLIVIEPEPGVIGPASELAERIARHAHQGQRDKIGEPYIDHPAWVANRLAQWGHRDEVVAAGWLHDVVEDTDWTVEVLRAAGLPEATVTIVKAMTRRPFNSSVAYYEGLIECGPDAVAVKVADIEHNTLPERTARLDAKTRERLSRKYAKALTILQRRS